ncbi:MAG TPA: enoyl-CoA hydratase-related protein [Lapillicoccus sp.]|jgi:2-(1,2-epoxy-1,2-dihydrophenyl)acetyl-CoA isomerase|uniref:enoyl-CoA hydratase/isomerase family protein n=1 Tax=Lapillicoccus sp. TaxID=1909287 RepID=UPI002F938FA6
MTTTSQEQAATPEPTADTADRTVELRVDGGVATVVLNRPDAMNAVDLALKVRLLEILQQVADDPAVRCVVLTGRGRAFCVGQDLKEHIGALMRGDEALGSTVVEHYNKVAMLLATMNKPVVAALNGVTAGAGASMAFACDVRILVEGAGINLAFAAIALSCDTGSSWWLPRLVGTAKAKELLMLPRTIGSDECLSLGLVTQVVPADQFEQTVSELARTLAAGPTLAYGSIRRAVAASAGQDLETALAHEAELMTLTGASADHRAAVDAFLAKEKPVFEGR